jgi:hypothetical protein
MYHLYLVARRREPGEAPRFAGEITLRARAAARAQERDRLLAECRDERGEPPRRPRVVARVRARVQRARPLGI